MNTSDKKFISIATAIALLGQVASGALLASSAQAADMLGEPAQEYTNVEFGTGWYLRGDVGLGYSETKLSVGAADLNSDANMPSTFTIGGGYKISENFRAEIALNRFASIGSDGRGDASCGATEDHDNSVLTANIPVTGACYNEAVVEGHASSLMLNGYFDLSPIVGFQPYVGAGAGLAYVTWNNLTYGLDCEGSGPTDCGIAATTQARYGSPLAYTKDTSLALAANAMAGLSYSINKNTKLDLGYRFTYLNDGGDPSVNDGGGGSGPFQIDGTMIHEVRVGVRYEIW